MSEDATLLDAARAGDADALRVLLEQYGEKVWVEIDREISAPWRSLFDADDVMQVSYMEAFLQAAGLAARDGAAFAAWLRQIARNNLRDAIRELQCQKRPNPARRVRAGAGEDSHVALIELIGYASTTPSRAAARQEAASAVEAALARMPPDYATVIRLYDLEGRNAAEVASQMDRSSGAVYMLRARAHEALRSLLGDARGFLTRTA